MKIFLFTLSIQRNQKGPTKNLKKKESNNSTLASSFHQRLLSKASHWIGFRTTCSERTTHKERERERETEENDSRLRSPQKKNRFFFLSFHIGSGRTTSLIFSLLMRENKATKKENFHLTPFYTIVCYFLPLLLLLCFFVSLF